MQTLRRNEIVPMTLRWMNWKTVFRLRIPLETEWEAKEITESINRFLACLEQDNRVMFVQRYWYSTTITELAELFHTSNHNVSVRLSRIRTKLRKHLMKEGIFL